MKTFLSVLRRYKMAAFLNVLGLSVAFAAFMVIMMQVDYERTFDRSHPQAERIYRADLMRGDYVMQIHSRGLLDAIVSSSPHIEAGTLINPFVGSIYVTVGEGEGRRGFREPFVTCYPDLTRIFGFSFVEGDGGCLGEPDKVIIPRSMAQRFFGGEPAIGKPILANETIWTKDLRTLTVGGVYRDFPGNTQINNVIYTAIDNTMLDEWTSSNFICYLLLDSPDSAEGFTEELNRSFDFSRAWNPENSALSISLTPLSGVYFSEYTDVSVFKTGNENTIRVLFLIALLVIAIAAINFTNFSIALAPARIRSINTRKILGSSTGSLRWALLGEALGIAFASWLIALLITAALDDSRLLPFIEADMSLMNNLPLALLTGGIALLVGLVAGLYPAWYVTSFQPALTLKGTFALSPSGRLLRTALIGFQYVISIGLIVAAIFIQLQNNYMKGFDQGFDKDRIAIVELNRDLYRKSKDTYVNKLKEYPGVDDVAFARQKLGTSDVYTTYGLKYIDREFYGYVLEVSPNFPQVMGIPILSGRSFLPSDEQQQEEPKLTFIFNRTVQSEIGMEPGSAIEMTSWKITGQTAGIVGDLKLTSLRQEADPVCFMVNPRQTLPISFIRLKAGANVADAVSHIRRCVAEIDPTFPFEVEFYDGLLEELYRKEAHLNKTITLLSLLAIVISVVGVFGLVLFETQYRRKEIGIRKVHGATMGEILAMFNRIYLRIVCICFVIAAPVAWVAVSLWLMNFAYRTPMHWWVFACAFVIVAAITLATVTLQSRQAANANPVESIKES